jgi:hypothetical protein
VVPELGVSVGGEHAYKGGEAGNAPEYRVFFALVQAGAGGGIDSDSDSVYGGSEKAREEAFGAGFGVVFRVGGGAGASPV